jgi:hypothetical protein
MNDYTYNEDSERDYTPFDAVNQSPLLDTEYLYKINTLKENIDNQELKRLAGIVNPKILELRNQLHLAPSLANITVSEARLKTLSFDKDVILTKMFIDRNEITPDDETYINKLCKHLFYLLTRAIGPQRERITQAQQMTTNTSIVGHPQELEKKPSLFNLFGK